MLQLFVSLGYPRQGVDWIRRRRGWVILMLAVLAWGVLLAVGYTAFQTMRLVLGA